MLCKIVDKFMFKLLFTLILLLRISFFFFPSFQIDMNSWKAWSQRLVEVGPSNFYSEDYFSDYFPGYLYVLWIIGSLFNLFSIPINNLSFELILKTITTMFDIGSAFFIYKIITKHNKSWAIFGSLFYLLNPAAVFNSSIWGQIDGIFTFFLIYASYLFIERKNISRGSLATALGILVKPHSLAMLPIILIYSFQNFSKALFLRSLFIIPIFLVIISSPFFINNSIFGIFEKALKSQDVYQYTSLFAFNFWSLIGFWKPDNQGFILAYRNFGLILYAFSLILILVPLFKKKITSKEFYILTALSFFAFFLFLTRIHERYLFPALAFILIAAFVSRSKFLIGAYVLSSIIHLVNLWYVYYYFNFVYINPKLGENVLYLTIGENSKLFSIINLILFTTIMIFYYRIYAKKS